MELSGRESLLAAARGGKRALLRALDASGVSSAIGRSEWRRQQLCILCYHGVSLENEHEWLPELFVTPGFLRRRLELLRDSGCTVLDLGDAVANLYDGTLPEKSVVITFDDGFYNFHAAAAPILEEFQIPATNYVSTYFCINQRPLLDLSIRYMVWSLRGKSVTVRQPDCEGNFDLRNVDERKALIEKIQRAARRLEDDRAAQSDWMSRIAGDIGFDWEALIESRILHLMNAAEIREMAERGFDIQLHTHRHRTPRQQHLFEGEIRENKSLIEKMTGQSATHFCYPSGDYDSSFLPWLEDAGIETATIGTSSLARRDHHPLLLPRYIDTEFQTDTAFLSWVNGVNDRLRLRKV